MFFFCVFFHLFSLLNLFLPHINTIMKLGFQASLNGLDSSLWAQNNVSSHNVMQADAEIMVVFIPLRFSSHVWSTILTIMMCI